MDWNTVERDIKTEIDTRTEYKKESASPVGLCQKDKPQRPHHVKVSPRGQNEECERTNRYWMNRKGRNEKQCPAAREANKAVFWHTYSQRNIGAPFSAKVILICVPAALHCREQPAKESGMEQNKLLIIWKLVQRPVFGRGKVRCLRIIKWRSDIKLLPFIPRLRRKRGKIFFF